MLLGDSEGNENEPFIVYKSFPAKSKEKQDFNNSERNGFGVTVWRKVQPLQNRHRCRIFGNQTAWWNFQLSLKFLKFHCAERDNFDENVILLWPQDNPKSRNGFRRVESIDSDDDFEHCSDTDE
ncbi:hypothetical protein PHMEG_0004711 [Phytophthora megakarya]|uniref:Uncharacterized protein n=1 Tax=Phytophthora megakarya TaxID=4795 RepID=A0A225WT71_9STRA|nr:hypothetical protein PHMEG_0004711 [Phytophthora megakarya]